MSPKSGGSSDSSSSSSGHGIGTNRTVGWRHFIYGGLASCIAEMGTFPLDTTKTRLQIQGQQAKHLISCGVSPIRTSYAGMFDALFRIPKEEGLTALYRGISPALLRQSIYGTLKFGVYYSLKKLFPEETLASNILCAVFAGMTSSALANPTDVLKVRMQVASSMSPPLITSFIKIYNFEGLQGLWRGVGPTSQRAGIIAAVELPVYDGCKKYMIEKGILDDSMPNHVLSSFIASFATVIASTPIDVIRTRLMSQKLHRSGETNEVKPGKIYRGSMECFITTLRYEGIRALYKGFLPAWLRMGPWNLIFFTSYEQLLRLY